MYVLEEVYFPRTAHLHSLGEISMQHNTLYRFSIKLRTRKLCDAK